MRLRSLGQEQVEYRVWGLVRDPHDANIGTRVVGITLNQAAPQPREHSFEVQ